MSLLTLACRTTSAAGRAQRLAFADADQPAALARLRALPGVPEAAMISTCNRTEIMTVRSRAEPVLLEWWRREPRPSRLIERYFYTHRDLGAVAHSLRCGGQSIR